MAETLKKILTGAALVVLIAYAVQKIVRLLKRT